MTLNKAKQQYNELNEKGELKEMFPFLSGKWDEDKFIFISLMNDNNIIT